LQFRHGIEFGEKNIFVVGLISLKEEEEELK
jgi:hypothetical protein